MSTDPNITDAVTANAALVKTRDELAAAVDARRGATAALRDAVIIIRPSGILDVDEMAEAVGRDRNYIDATWSSYGDTSKGKQTRVSTNDADAARVEAALNRLRGLAATLRRALDAEDVARAAHHRNIAVAYGSTIKGFGPSAIAGAAGIDRNHVLRVSRAAGVAPVWRKPGTSKNQWTVSK